MTFEQYKRYIIDTANGYSKVIKRKLVNDLLSKGIAVKSAQQSMFDCVNLSNIEENEQLIKCINERNEAVKLFEEWEYIKNYKYSVMFSMTNFDKSIIDILIGNGAVKKLSDNETEQLSSYIGVPYVFESEGLIFLKFNLKSEAIHPRTAQEILIKHPILVVIFSDENILEIRYDSINSLFERDTNFYIDNIKQIREWTTTKLNIRIENIVLEPIIEHIKTNKDEVILFGQYMELGSGGTATLEVGKNEEYVLPFLGELKQILVEYKDEFDSSPVLKDVITQFINEKEETSNYPWIILRWKDEMKTRIIDVKFSFNYMQQKFCLLQHYSNANIGMERMNYVTRYIVKNQEFVTE